MKSTEEPSVKASAEDRLDDFLEKMANHYVNLRIFMSSKKTAATFEEAPPPGKCRSFNPMPTIGKHSQ